MTTLLQISDPHLMSDTAGTLKGIATARALSSVLDLARTRYPACARVIWTGDLSHEHSVAGYRLLRDQLGDWLARSLFIPGNHDDRRALREVFPAVGGQDAEIVSFCVELPGSRLVGLDSQLPGEVAGILSDEQLVRLESWLSGSAAQPTLLFLHHPPASVGSRWLDELGLRNPAALERLVRRSPSVRGIFCGHAHQAFEGMFAGVPLYCAPSTAFQFQPGAEEMAFDLVSPGFRVIALEENEYRTHVVRLSELEYAPLMS